MSPSKAVSRYDVVMDDEYYVLMAKADALRGAGNFVDARAALLEARRLAEESEDLGARVDSAVKLASLELLAREPARGMTVLNPILALIHSERAEEIREAAAEWSLVDAHITYANCAREMLDYDVAAVLPILEACDEFVTRIGRPEWRPDVMLVRAKVYTDLDRVDEAVSVMEEAVSAARENIKNLRGFTFETFERRLADAYYESDRFVDAARVYGGIVEKLAAHPLDRLGASLGLAKALLKLGRPVAAVAVIAEAAADPAMFDRQKFAVASVQVKVYVAAGELELARVAAETTLSMAKRGGEPGRLCSAYQHQAAVAIAEKRLDEAREFLDRAMPLAEQLDARTRRTANVDEVRELYDRLESAES